MKVLKLYVVVMTPINAVEQIHHVIFVIIKCAMVFQIAQKGMMKPILSAVIPKNPPQAKLPKLHLRHVCIFYLNLFSISLCSYCFLLFYSFKHFSL